MVIPFVQQIPIAYNVHVESDTKTGKVHITTLIIHCDYNPHVHLVEVDVFGFPKVKFELMNMVMDTTRFEQYPGYSNASQCANGKTYSVIPGLDTVHKDRPVMLFNEKRICTTVYLPGDEVMKSEHKSLLNEINGILYNIYCEGKIPMTNAAKMSSGPVDIKLYYASHKSESE